MLALPPCRSAGRARDCGFWTIFRPPTTKQPTFPQVRNTAGFARNSKFVQNSRSHAERASNRGFCTIRKKDSGGLTAVVTFTLTRRVSRATVKLPVLARTQNHRRTALGALGFLRAPARLLLRTVLTTQASVRVRVARSPARTLRRLARFTTRFVQAHREVAVLGIIRAPVELPAIAMARLPHEPAAAFGTSFPVFQNSHVVVRFIAKRIVAASDEFAVRAIPSHENTSAARAFSKSARTFLAIER